MKRAPRSISGLLAGLLSGMGAAFALVGAVFAGLGVIVEGGGPGGFVLYGLLLLGAGGACALVRFRQRRAWTRLRAEGVPRPGRVLEVRHRLLITWNVDSVANLPGRNSPWTVRCGYTWNGRAYTVNSELLWREPLENSPGFTICVDPARPERAWADPDTLRYRWTG